MDWNNQASEEEKKLRKEQLVQASLELGEIVGGGGTYVNEANPYEPNWQKVFWGPNYETLLRIKRRIDPKNVMTCNRCVHTDIVYEP